MYAVACSRTSNGKWIQLSTLTINVLGGHVRFGLKIDELWLMDYYRIIPSVSPWPCRLRWDSSMPECWDCRRSRLLTLTKEIMTAFNTNNQSPWSGLQETLTLSSWIVCMPHNKTVSPACYPMAACLQSSGDGVLGSQVCAHELL